MKRYTTGFLFVVSLILVTSFVVKANVARSSALPQQLIQNGGFETGWTSWQHVGTTTLVGSNPVPHSGLVSARLVATTNVNNAVAQIVTIPSNMTGATLSYWYLINTPGGPYTGDIHFVVKAIDTVSSDVYFTDSIDLSNTNGNTGWVPITADLFQSFNPAGRSVAVSFAVVSNDGAHPTIVGVDDVGIVVDDTMKPTLAEVTPVSTPTNDSTPDYTFSSSEDGTISYSGGCTSVTTVAVAGNNTVTFDALADGTYGSCDITVTDFATNASDKLPVSEFTIDTTKPVLLETTPVLTPTNNPTPSYTFNSTEAGTIGYSGGCTSTTILAIAGDNTITFDALADGTYGSCGIMVNDTATNASDVLSVTPFTIDTTPPVVTVDPYNTAPTNQDVTVTASTNEGTLNVTSHTFTANGSFDFVATDDAGNVTTTTVTITNIDKDGPVFSSSLDITQEATSSSGNVVTYTNPIATDAMDGAVAVSCSPLSGSIFPLGGTLVTCTATDSVGNTTTSTFKVTVQDTTKPVITLLGSSPVTIEKGAAYADAGATAKDAIDGTLVVKITGSVNSLFLGEYTLTYTATDKSGNSATATRVVRVVTPALVTVAPVGIVTVPAPSAPAELVGKVLGEEVAVPFITAVKKYHGKTAIPARDRMITVRAFGQYTGKIFAKTVNFPDGKKITIVVPQKANKYGTVAVYDTRGLLIQRIKPFGRYAIEGLRASIGIVNNEPYLAIGAKNGVHVLTYRITGLGLIKTDKLNMSRQGTSRLYFNFLNAAGQSGIAVVVRNAHSVQKRFYTLDVGTTSWRWDTAVQAQSLRLAASAVTTR